MSNKIFASVNGTWDDMERTIKTAFDWQAHEIVIVGIAGLEPVMEELSARWDQYQIPISVLPNRGEDCSDVRFTYPPFVGVSQEDSFARKVLESNAGQAVFQNGVLRSYRPIQKSAA